jgi:cytoskeletal protein CcmA (bactofilin family)
LFKKNKYSSIDTLIDETMNIRGNMTFAGGIRLDGKLVGSLTLSDGAHGTLIMGEKSKITGDIITDSAIIAGEVKGNIQATEFLELHSSAKILGDIEYSTIEIHAGAKINGQLIEVKKNKLNKKNLENKEVKNDK